LMNAISFAWKIQFTELMKKKRLNSGRSFSNEALYIQLLFNQKDMFWSTFDLGNPKCTHMPCQLVSYIVPWNTQSRHVCQEDTSLLPKPNFSSIDPFHSIWPLIWRTAFLSPNGVFVREVTYCTI
jgi:hypothetical protein